MTQNSPFNVPLNFGETTKKIERRTKFPWELRDSSKFVNKLCKRFLVEMFDPSLTETLGNNYGYDFKSKNSGKTYSVRARCLTDQKSWECNLYNSKADAILFFGFRDNVNPDLEKAIPKLEFCLEIPKEGFRGKRKISILDNEGRSLEEYKEFWIDSEKSQRMREVMAVIENKDESKIKEFFPRIYDGHYRQLD